MAFFTGHVVNGRLVVDAPIDLPDGTEVDLESFDGPESLPPEEQAKLEASLAIGLEQANRGELIDEEDVWDELYGP